MKKILKQEFFDFIMKNFKVFPNNENFLGKILKFSKNLLKNTDLILHLNLEEFINFLFDYLLISEIGLSFTNKSKILKNSKFLI